MRIRISNPFILLLLGLIITFNSALGQAYRGAELRTLDSLLYGRFETSLKASQGDGYLSSFFIYNDDYPSSDWAEIDFEILGRWPNNVDVNVIDEIGSHLRQHPVDVNLHLDFHQYAFEWTPEYVAWFFDDQEFYRQSGPHIETLSQPGKLMMNMWAPAFTDWVGVMDARILPRYAYYDWVTYASYTPGEGTTGTNSNFTPVWTDSFDVFDSTRWEKSDGHSWNGNNSILVANNIVYEDGDMILCLTLPGEEGIQDSDPPSALWARALTLDSILVRYSELLDPVTASTASTFVIPGINVESATLNPDNMTVTLKLSSPLTGPANVYALGLKDIAEPPNLQMGALVAIDLPNPLSLPIRIDCAGPGRQGFLPDQLWNSSTEYGHEGGNYQQAVNFPDLANTELDSVMATSLNRYSRYHVRLQPGLFTIQLHFAEHEYDGVGQRTFELFVEDELVVPELDVFAEAGNSNVYTVTLPNVTIRDGSLDIIGAALEYGLGYAYAGPVLNAIEITGEYWLGVNDPVLPQEYGLHAIFPNPFNNSAQVTFRLAQTEAVDISIYGIRGNKIMNLIDQALAAGEHRLTLNAEGFSSGVYFVNLHSETLDQSQKILYLK